MTRARAKRLARTVIGIVLAPIVALVVRAATMPLPNELAHGDYAQSVRYVDRDGRLLREVRADDAARARWVPLDEVGDTVVKAVLAAEDRHFWSHPGVDPVAVVRAAAADAYERRVVSGASTLTMQLARLVRPHARTPRGKFDEAALALRIEASLSKKQILEQYLNRAPFGAGVRGIDAASRYWLDKPPRDLSVAEAAALAAIPRGPAVYSMTKHPERVLRRRDRILDRMVAAGWIDRDTWARAKAEPLAVRAGKGSFGAPHFVQAVADGVFGAEAALANDGVVLTTIDSELESEVETAARATIEPLASRHVTAASVVVLDNASGDVLAYVGSLDFDDAAHGGQNDGVRARRQPGSTLKPFVYGLAMERLGFTPATVLPDVELHVPVASGVYAPMNFDERFHGPVRLREALASSLNVPAVWTAEQVGVPSVLERLHAIGFASLDESAEWYGPGLALGDGEVTLLELANAYATLARGGVWRSVRAVTDDKREATERRVMPREVAAMLTDILADKDARLAAFGAGSVLDLPFDVAAKTGTSKGFRDNWTVGFTREVTVAVWGGNFDGSPMRGTSGITGAGPLFRAAMEAAMRGREAHALRLARISDEALVEVEVCPLSGGAPTHACPHAVREWMTPAARASLAPCAMHERVRLDVRNGLRAATCAPSLTREQTFEHFEAPFAAWARTAGRDLAPREQTPLCAGARARDPNGAAVATLHIGYPHDGARFVVDPDRPRAQQTLAVRIDAPAAIDRVELFVDGRPIARVGAPFVASWTITPGDHVLVAQAAGATPSDRVTVSVE
jgi:penicillin-binding protein 1C